MYNRRKALASLAAVCLVAGPPAASAQRIQGTAWDSLNAAPLRGAMVAVVGQSMTAMTDSSGHFVLENLPAGSYTLTLQHDALDSIGVSGLKTRAAVTAPGVSEVHFAIPSFASLWHSICGGSEVPSDSGIVLGTVRDVRTRSAVAGASVIVGWLDVSATKGAEIKQRLLHNDMRTSATGAFGACGVPSGMQLRLFAETDSLVTATINLMPGRSRVQRVDLYVGPRESTAATHGTIIGTVVNEDDRAIQDARVATENLPEVRTNAKGEFVIRDVPSGTRQIEVLALGAQPTPMILDVFEHDTTNVIVHVHKVATLAEVKVEARGVRDRIVRDIDERRRNSLGRFMDSTAVAGHGTLAAVFREFPSVNAELMPRSSRFTITVPCINGVGRCTARLFIDGILQRDFDDLNMMRPDDIAVVEVYARAFEVPLEFIVKGQPTGTVVVWTKHAMP